MDQAQKDCQCSSKENSLEPVALVQAIEIQLKNEENKPNRLTFVKMLILLNFFGFVIILTNGYFVYFYLFDFSNSIFSLITTLGLAGDVIFFLGWALFFGSTMQRKINNLKICIFCIILSIFFKFIFFFNYISISQKEKRNIALILVLSIYLCFQLFTFCNLLYVIIKIKSIPEKIWKNEFKIVKERRKIIILHNIT